MSDPEEILGHVRAMLGRNGALAGKRVVVSAGGTREPLDPGPNNHEPFYREDGPRPSRGGPGHGRFCDAGVGV